MTAPQVEGVWLDVPGKNSTVVMRKGKNTQQMLAYKPLSVLWLRSEVRRVSHSESRTRDMTDA